MARRVLVIEDEPENRLLLEMILTTEGFNVVQAEDGPSGLEIIQNWRPDIILLDVMMPDLNGFGVFDKLRASEATRDIPVIMLTALAQRAEFERAVEMGVDGYLTKPFEPADLLQAMETALNRSL